MKAHKYGAKAIVIDNIRFASQKEGRRYQELKLLEKAGEIRGLTLQPSFDLVPWKADHSDVLVIGRYRGDFAYEQQRRVWTANGWKREDWQRVVEDVKGFKTPLYKWKKKHVEAQYDIEIREV